jgi:hypothetical protein
VDERDVKVSGGMMIRVVGHDQRTGLKALSKRGDGCGVESRNKGMGVIGRECDCGMGCVLCAVRATGASATACGLTPE